ncbi:hypothetical protein ACC732_34870 [Rhizobium ruizarguesonis]
MNYSSATMAALLAVSGCTTTDPGNVSTETIPWCDFIPAAADVAALFEVVGANKMKLASELICNAVNKRKAEILAQRNASEAGGGEVLTSLPAGTEITVVVKGKRISGLTTPPLRR